MRGLFISFEGIDGAGKSTHIAALAQRFCAQGREVTLTREPGGTPLAEQLRNMVLNEPMDPMTEALLVFAARREHIVQVIRPALGNGNVVICDRFTDSTFAYQGAGRSFDWGVLSTLEQWVQASVSGSGKPHGLLQPELTLWFDLSPEIAAQRLASARIPDKFEAQSAEFFAQVASGYAKRMALEPNRFARIDSSQLPEAVWLQVESAVRTKGLLP